MFCLANRRVQFPKLPGVSPEFGDLSAKPEHPEMRIPLSLGDQPLEGVGSQGLRAPGLKALDPLPCFRLQAADFLLPLADLLPLDFRKCGMTLLEGC